MLFNIESPMIFTFFLVLSSFIFSSGAEFIFSLWLDLVVSSVISWWYLRLLLIFLVASRGLAVINCKVKNLLQHSSQKVVFSVLKVHSQLLIYGYWTHFFLYQSFLIRILTTHRTAGVRMGPSFITHYHFHPITNTEKFIWNFAC